MPERIGTTSVLVAAACLLIATGCASHGRPQAAPASNTGPAPKSGAAAREAAAHADSGNLYLTSGQWDAAEREYRLALQSDPSNQAALAGLGRIAVARGQYEQAVPLLEQATRVPSQMASTLRALGDAYAATGNLEGAASAYREAVALSPGDPGVRLSLAAALMRVGEFDEAGSVCRGAIRLSKGNPSLLAKAYQQLGEIYSYEGRTAEAIAALYKASELSPRDVEVARGLGGAVVRAGLYGEAAAAYARLLQLAPLDLDAKRQLAWVNFKLERYPAAIKDYESVGDSLDVADRYYLAQAYAKTDRVDRAAELFRAVAREDPEHYKGVYCNMAYAYYDANRYQRAIEAAREGLANDSTSACLRFCWAQALDKLGRHEEAIPVFEAVLNDPAYSQSAQQELERQRRIMKLMQTNQKPEN
jgi:tetratricopeptide (TPR) repeat protein